MPRSTPDVAGTSIALIGAFDPARAQPSVLLQEGLIRESDFLDLTVQIALPDIMQLHMAWALLTVEKNRIIAATPVTNPAAEPVRDLALDLVSEMKESRVRAIGINSDHHFQALSLDTFHKVGNTLAPKDLWNKLLKVPGMQSLFIIAQRTVYYSTKR
ncbi:MAG TPA: hypothetical protein VNY32_00245 [Candidatus Acidoferrales bacterium]|nr:hypothetical protein [Candidatus Acidoferrales bacterium]